MANWAKLQEQLTGLPVVKRARHGIHFDKGNGEIVANFSGKPCHYEEKGVWKPIDTKLLLLPDGFYGSPHSDVKIHKDGRVKAGGYQQKSALVDAKEGVVDGDKIVREFKFGTQYLYMKEDGFRQETVITRPPTTAEAKYLIASESGELPSKYKRSDITAVDADGAVHEFVNLGQFKKWLDAAAYPVTIDPDFISQPAETNAKDSWIREVYPNGNYQTAGTSEISTYGAGDYSHTIIEFDVSSVPSGSNISAGTLVFKKAGGNSGVTAAVYRLLVSWTESGVTWNSRDGSNNWSTAGAKGSGTDRYASATDEKQVINDGDASFSVASDIQLFVNGTINYGWVIAPTSTVNRHYYSMYSSNTSTESYRPVLTVTYTTGSTGVPKHFLHYARLRSN